MRQSGAEEKIVMVMHAGDNVGICLREIDPNQAVQVGEHTIEAASHIPLGHKIALRDISEGSEVIKYGEVIGQAKIFIRRGEHVHDHYKMDY